MTLLVIRDRTGLAQVVLPAGTPVPPEETPVRATGVATQNPQAPGGVEVTEATVEPLSEPALTPPAELSRPTLDVGLPTLLDHAPVLWRHPAQRARWDLAAAALRGFRRTLDGLGFTEVLHPGVRRVRHRVRRQRLRARLLRPAGVPGAEPPVLQAAACGCLRAGLRGRAGLACRTARHRAAPGRVPLPWSSGSSETTATC